jgi:acyl transferase domain-containing protein
MAISEELHRPGPDPAKLDAKSIAIIGLSCRFPSEASNVEGFWSFIQNRKCTPSLLLHRC